ncbi:mitochondrial carrier domain-containing protein [Lasiosphaeris hirsuta]|uniref:Mitochondrial carrier domain-containing protein n=1 Tax=Lasiosphaeris hirsuta TaxID=260670 RepID=A0AA40AZE9_9PEZI|nr:mitochondrial carrier domain-containing protein [Lasiosphaeris hirsuta]
MSADFWAGYISGAISIIIGNPLDVLKVRLQASPAPPPLPPPLPSPVPGEGAPGAAGALIPSAGRATLQTQLRPWLTGTAAPVLGYGALNALLFVTYNRSESWLNAHLFPTTTGIPAATGSNLYTTFLAGALGGLATWVVSTPTELIKCRAQLSSTGPSSWAITRHILRHEGPRGLYFGGGVTALRDSVGYGFYFWSYELTSRWMRDGAVGSTGGGGEAARVLLCGGLAGIATWASIFPLDVIKTRVQTQNPSIDAAVGRGELAPLVGARGSAGTEAQNTKLLRLGAWDVAKETYAQGGIRPFFRGLAVCSVRAFIVNAAQWAVYEWIMLQLGQGRIRQDPPSDISSMGTIG